MPKVAGDSLTLIPYDREYDDSTLMTIGSKTSATKIKMIKVSGFNLPNVTPEEKITTLRSLYEGFFNLKTNEVKIALIGIKENVNYSVNYHWILECEDRIKKSNFLNPKQKQAQLDIVREAKEPFLDGDLSGNKKVPQFFFGIYGNKKEEVDQQTENFASALQSANLTAEPCDSYQIFSVLFRIADYYSPIPSREMYEANKDNFAPLMSYKDFTFNAKNAVAKYEYVEDTNVDLSELEAQLKDYKQRLARIPKDDRDGVLEGEIKELQTQINDLKYAIKNKKVEYDKDGRISKVQKKGTIWQSYRVLAEWPEYPDLMWAYSMFNLADSAIVLKIGPTSEQRFEKNLEKAISNAEANLNGVKHKHQVQISRDQKVLQKYHEVVNHFGSGEDKFKHISVTMITYATTQKKLNALNNKIDDILGPSKLKFDSLLFEQFEGYKSVQLTKNDPLSSKYGRDTNLSTLAYMFPFITSSINNPKGFYLAENNLGEALIINMFQNLEKVQNVSDGSRLNANFLAIGKSGSGKSTLLKNMILLNLISGTRFLMLDPEGEYKGICQDVGGTWIDASDGTKSRINPLQLLADVDTSEENEKENAIPTNEQLIQAQIRWVSDWMPILYPEWDTWSKLVFSNVLGEVYQKWNKKMKNKPVYLWEPEDFPIFSDIVDYLKQIPKTKHEIKDGRDLTDELLYTLETDFVKPMGRYTSIYNGHSTIKSLNSPMVVFDIKRLVRGDSKTMLLAQSALITVFIQNEVLNIYQNTKDKVAVVIDEAHILIDESNTFTLDFVYSMVKLIRKRRGGVWLATQNPEDFTGDPKIAKKTTAMLNNVSTSWFGKMTSKNINEVDKLYESSNGLTQNQIQWIVSSKNGKGMWIFEDTNKQLAYNKPMEYALKKYAV